MKKFIIATMVVLFGFVVALPATAADVKFSGEYFSAGVINSNPALSDNHDEATDSFMHMRLRTTTEFILSDDLKLTTRFDALEKAWDRNDSADTQDDDNIDFERAYITAKTDIGLFMIGRQKGITWGTSFSDDCSNTDRIKYVVPLDMGGGKLYVGAVYEKYMENDHNDYSNSSQNNDTDNDKYYLFAVHKTDDYQCGLLTGFYNFEYFQDPDQVLALQAFTAASTDPGAYLLGLPGTYNSTLGMPGAAGTHADILYNRGGTTDADVFLLSPYFKGKYGDIGITFEMDYFTGTAEYPDALVANAEDLDIEAHSILLEGTYDYGAWVFQAGFATMTGDADPSDDEINAMGYVSTGADWQKAFILSGGGSGITGMTHGMTETLGGVGNHVGGGIGGVSKAQLDGFQMLYMGFDYAATDDITLGCLIAVSEADEVPDDVAGSEKYEEDQGVEVDLKLNWKIMDNLELDAVAAFLSAGDYWDYRVDGTEKTDEEDLMCLYTRITLTF